MKETIQISVLQNLEWEAQHPEEFELYREISETRLSRYKNIITLI